jgi:Tol biopolymer transport system component
MGRICSRRPVEFLALAVLPITAAAAQPAAHRASVHKEASTEDHFPAKLWSMSADGNVVTFSVDDGYPYESPPDNVIYARDVAAGTTTRVSYPGGIRPGSGAARPAALRRVPGNGVNPYNVVSADGRYVAFAQWLLLPRYDVVVYDRTTRTQRTASVALGGAVPTGDSFAPSLSADGRYVAFASDASNLVAGDSNDATDVFVRDLVAGTTRRVSLGAGGRQGDAASGGSGAGGPAISADGRYVAFGSGASNLVPGDTNGRVDVFVRDLVAGTTRLVSRSSAGVRGNGDSVRPAISANGRYVGYESDATDLVPGDTNDAIDVFVRDLAAGTTARVSLVDGGRGQANGFSSAPALSAAGRYAEFTSTASNLVAGDTNATPDVFVRDLRLGRTYRVSVGAHGQTAGYAAGGALSAAGRYVAFDSGAPDLVPGDTNQVRDVFRRDRYARVTLRISLDGA